MAPWRSTALIRRGSGAAPADALSFRDHGYIVLQDTLYRLQPIDWPLA